MQDPEIDQMLGRLFAAGRAVVERTPAQPRIAVAYEPTLADYFDHSARDFSSMAENTTSDILRFKAALSLRWAGNEPSSLKAEWEKHVPPEARPPLITFEEHSFYLSDDGQNRIANLKLNRILVPAPVA